MRRHILLAFAIISQFDSAQAMEMPRFKKGEDYGVIRQKMLKAGWKPYHRKDADECSSKDVRCAGRPEMEACAGSGLGNCLFLWVKNKKIIAIGTIDSPAVFDAFGDAR